MSPSGLLRVSFNRGRTILVDSNPVTGSTFSFSSQYTIKLLAVMFRCSARQDRLLRFPSFASFRCPKQNVSEELSCVLDQRYAFPPKMLASKKQFWLLLLRTE